MIAHRIARNGPLMPRWSTRRGRPVVEQGSQWQAEAGHGGAAVELAAPADDPDAVEDVEEVDGPPTRIDYPWAENGTFLFGLAACGRDWGKNSGTGGCAAGACAGTG
jgi:hypothetical protein